MSTMSMYRLRWPAMKFGPKYEKKRPRIAKDFKSACDGHWVALMACVRKEKENSAPCQRFLLELYDCVDAAERRTEVVKAAKYRLSKFMRGRETFGIII
mmetsp:Transcript_127673/g.190316  ORF Transcript_127673/g.190316 Transcript_127673/m.190316 type:complete len:99 (+) Transcript_127673:32-328(+)